MQTLRLRRASTNSGQSAGTGAVTSTARLNQEDGLALAPLSAASSRLHESVSAALSGLGVAHLNEREVE